MARTRPNVSRLARRGKLDALREALHYSEPTSFDDGTERDLGTPVRVEAVEALAGFDGTTVAGDLGAALDDPEPDVQLAALRTLDTLGVRADGDVERLVACVVARDRAAADVTAGALKLLVGWRAHGSAELVVERLLDRDAPEPDQGHRASLELLLTTDSRGPSARDAVTDLLIGRLQQREGARAEERAERMFGWLGGSAVDKVIDALEHGTATPALIQAAGQLGDGRAVGPVVRALESPDPEMREASANAARALNHTRAVPALLTATQDDEQAVRDAASAALDRMGTAAVIAGLAAVVSARGLLATSPQPGLEGTVADLLEANGGPELGEGEGATEGGANRAAGPETRAPPTADPRPPAPPSAPEHPAPRRRRSGGFLDRLLGRDQY